jgi:hypothetical protein
VRPRFVGVTVTNDPFRDLGLTAGRTQAMNAPFKGGVPV